jgi:hypothetical protein
MARSRDVADTQDNQGGAVAPFVAGKNAIINGGFDWWQRGTSGSVGGSILYIADRWQSLIFSGGTMNWSQVATSNTPVGSRFALRVQRPNAATSTATMNIGYSVETNDSLRFAGQIFTLSFWAKANANFSAASNTLNVQVATGTGTDQSVYGGFTNAATPVNSTATLTSSWQRFTFTGTAASNITQIGLVFFYTPTGTAGAADSYDLTNVQLELGSVATPFSRAGGSIGGELALCQRYYYRLTPTAVPGRLGVGSVTSSTTAEIMFPFPVSMRTAPTAIEQSGTASDYSIRSITTNIVCSSVPASNNNEKESSFVNFTVSSGLTGGQVAIMRPINTNAYLGWSAEL